MDIGQVTHPEFIKDLENLPEVAYRMALEKRGPYWFLHTLVVNVFHEELGGKALFYNYKYDRVAFIAGKISGKEASEWLYPKDGQIDEYTFRSLLKQDDINHGVQWTKYPSFARNGFPAVPVPHTQYEVLFTRSPQQPPITGFLVSNACPFFPDFRAALYDLIYDIKDNAQVQNRSLQEAIIVRVAQTKAWIHEVHFSPTKLSVNVTGTKVTGSRLQISGFPNLSFDKQLVHRQTVEFPLSENIPQQLWIVLGRGSEWLDYYFLDRRWSPFKQQQGNVTFDPPDIRTRIQELIAQGEGQTTEFKKHISDDGGTALKTIAAFANGEGGVILLGIDDKSGEIVGVTESVNRTKDSITDIIRRKVVPEPEIRIESYGFNSKQVVAVYVEKGNSRPYGINPEKPEFYVRRGATTFPAKQEEIVALIQNSIKKSGITL